jgi:hypothetical protein
MTENGSNGRGYIQVAPHGRYFQFEDGTPFVPVGHNNVYQITEEIVKVARESGENTIRIWFHWDGADGTPDYDKLDHLLELAEQYDIYIMVAVFDDAPFTDLFSGRCRFNEGRTMYNGICARPEEFLTSPKAIDLQKQCIRYLVDRWGHSPRIFAWELMNQIDALYRAGEEEMAFWVNTIGAYFEQYELEKWGKAHLRSISSHDPVPTFDFFYNSPNIDFIAGHVYPESVKALLNTIDAALHINRTIKLSLSKMKVSRPYIDTENGPLAHVFDPSFARPPDEVLDEWFHNMSWAHLVSGGAGSGFTLPVADRMRPSPGGRLRSGLGDRLSPAQAQSQRAMVRFCRHIDWTSFNATNADEHVEVDLSEVIPMTCWDGTWMVAWLLRDTRVADSIEIIKKTMAENDITTPENQHSRLFALDVWDWLAKKTDFEPQSWHKRLAVSVLLKQGQEEERAMSLACRRIDESLAKFAFLTERDPALQKLWQNGRGPALIQPRVTFSGFADEEHQVTWFDDTTGEPIRTDLTSGSRFCLMAPAFSRHIAVLVRPVTQHH